MPFSNVGLAQRLVYLLAEHLAAPLTHQYIHVSEGTRRAYLQAGIGRTKPHVVVRSGMEIERFQAAEPPEDSNDILGATESGARRPHVILMLAALEARKRHEEFIRAFVQEVGNNQDIVLLLAGDGPEREQLHDLVQALGATRSVRLLGHRSDPHQLIALTDVTVLSSLREGLPRVVVQSLAGGRPAVVSPIEGIEEILAHGRNGLIAISDSAASVAQTAVALVRDPERLAALTRGAAESNVDEWTHAAMFRQLDRTYRAALRSSQSGNRVCGTDRSGPANAHDLASDSSTG